MKLTALCTMRLRYEGDFHLARPYGGESGLGWGLGDGTVTGKRLAGPARWSNHPTRRGDGAMLPNVRGVVTDAAGAEVFFDLGGRTVFVERDGREIGRQLLAVWFESEDPRYAWLNDTIRFGAGVIDPVALAVEIEVFVVES